MSEPEEIFEVVELSEEDEATDIEHGAPDYVEDAPEGAGVREIED